MKRIGILAGFVICLFSVCSIWPLSSWLHAFIRIEQMRLPYLGTFFLLLFFALAVLQQYLAKWPVIAVILVGAIVGQLAASISFSIAALIAPYGIDKAARAIEREGLVNYILVQLSVSFVLGGWLFGAIGAVVSRLLMRAFPKQATA